MLYGKYQFLCRLENEAHLPSFKGSTFRGVFGHALKKVVCALKRQECRECLLQNRCLYALVFETQAVLQPATDSKFKAAPHPFVIEPPQTPETNFQAGSAFDFNLLLFGEMNNSLPYFVYAIDQMGKIGIGKKINAERGRFVLKSVQVDDRIIYSDTDQKLNTTGALGTLSLNGQVENIEGTFRVKVILDTPLRIKFENRLKADLPFHVFVRAMLRRVSALMHYYGNGEPDMDYRGLVARARGVTLVASDLRWFDWQRYSQRQEREMLMGGMIGSVIYEGKIGEFMPLIDFCAKVHIGKQTAFGLGKFIAERVT
jgi:hypothetical protein